MDFRQAQGRVSDLIRGGVEEVAAHDGLGFVGGADGILRPRAYGGRWRPVVAPDLLGRPLGCGGLGMVSEESAENAREYRATVFGRLDN